MVIFEFPDYTVTSESDLNCVQIQFYNIYENQKSRHYVMMF